MTGIFLSLSRVLPAEYPLRDDVATYLDIELGFGRLLDYGVIGPRLQQLYEWSAHELGAPGLLECVRDGALTYAWPFEERHVWRAPRLDDGPGGAPGCSHPHERSATMSDDAVRRRSGDVRWVQRYLVNPPAKVAVWCGLVPGFVLVETTGAADRQAPAQRRRHEDRGRHRLGDRRVRPPRRLREQPRSAPRRAGAHAPPVACGRAHILDDDDAQARLESFHRRSHEAAVRQFGTDLLTIQFELLPT